MRVEVKSLALSLAFVLLSTLTLSCKGGESVISNRDGNSTVPAPLSAPASPACVKASEFSKEKSLWPPSNNHWMAPGAVASTRARFGGPGLDVGTLRVNQDGCWEILGAPESGDRWTLLDPTNSVHIELASGFNRYGPGWGYGPGHNMHDEATYYFHAKYGRYPSKMEKLDIEHNKSAWESLRAEIEGKEGKPDLSPTPAPSDVIISGPGQGQPGESLPYTVISDCKPSKWTWTAPGAIIQGRRGILLIQWREAGSYTIVVRGTGGGCGSASKVVNIGDTLPTPTPVTPTPVPPTPTPVDPTPTPVPQPDLIRGELRLMIEGKQRVFEVQEVRPPV